MRLLSSRSPSRARSAGPWILLGVLALLSGALLGSVRPGSGPVPDAATAKSGVPPRAPAYRNRALWTRPPPAAPPAGAAPRKVIAGKVYDTEGNGIPGAKVLAATFSVAGNIASEAGSTLTDEQGRFELSLPEATYQINAAREGHGPTSVTAHSGDTVSLVLPRSGVVEGRVLDERNRPVRRFTLEVLSASLASLPASPPLWSRTFDSPDGSFRVEELPSWSVMLRATAADLAPELSSPFKVAPGASRTIDLTLSAGCTLVGTVEDRSGARLPRVFVDVDARRAFGSAGALAAHATSGQTESESDGSFRLEHVPRGTVLVRGYDGASAVTTVKVEVSACEALKPVKLVMTPGGGVAGVARGGDGAPLTGARLTLLSREIGFVNTTSDAEGRFRFDEIPPGGVRLALEHEGQRTMAPVRVKGGEVTEHDIALLPAAASGELRGRVTAGDKPLPGIRLSIARSRAREEGKGIDVYSAVTDADGNYRVAAMPQGSYLVNLLSTNHGGTAQIEAGKTATLDLDVVARPDARLAEEQDGPP
ncbi:carboxypeptidase regulatory-like domain-containing protein [Sorangium sp. So ce233]|uniref:carboxypeptidase regulatory-like domain-containing protein n=1 Tax=Sorangium sp. So ce233 TaxID=3133290 RepID=UPI003F61A412